MQILVTMYVCIPKDLQGLQKAENDAVPTHRSQLKTYHIMYSNIQILCSFMPNQKGITFTFTLFSIFQQIFRNEK